MFVSGKWLVDEGIGFGAGGRLRFGVRGGDGGVVGEAGGDSREEVQGKAEGEAAGVVKLLAEDGDVRALDGAHHWLHRGVGICDYGCGHFAPFDYLGGFEGLAGCFAIGGNEPGCAQLDASEIAHYDDDNVGEPEGVDLAKDGLAGCA